MRWRSTAIRVLSGLPLYRVVPLPTLRTYAAVRYHEANSDPAAVCAYIDKAGARRLRHFSASWRAARSAFRAGRDDLLETLLEAATARYPAEPALHLIQSDLYLYRGDHGRALERAERARALDPASDGAASRVVRLTYETADRETADATAVRALRRFPTSTHVQWAVSKHCFTPEQFERVMAAWQEATAEVEAREPVERALRPLAAAAARVDLLDAANELYAQATLLRLDGVNAGTAVEEKRLAGKSARSAINDACDALEGAGIPFFFAAGTALGLVREGRPLDHDDDIDIGILDEHYDHERLVALFDRHPAFCHDVSHPRHTKIYLRHRAGSSLDVWRFYEDDGKVWHDGLFTRWWASPFAVAPRRIGGRDLPLPDDAEAYLEENYGNWRVPDSGFDAFTEAPNVEITWPEYAEYHRVRRAYLSTTAGRVREAVRQLGLARDSLTRTESGKRLLEVLAL